MYFVVTLFILIIIYVYYNYSNKLEKQKQFSSIKPNIDAALAGYLCNNNVDIFSLILSGLLSLVKQKYVKLEYINNDYVFISTIDKSDLRKLKKYELIAYNTVFPTFSAISLKELSLELKGNELNARGARTQSYVMKQAIIEELEKEGILKKIKSKKRTNMLSLRVIGSIFLVVFLMAETTYTLNIFLNIIQLCLIIYAMYFFCKKIYRQENIYTPYGKEVCNQIYGYYSYLKDNELFKERNIKHFVLWEDIYIYASAFHIPIVGIKEFISDEVTYRENIILFKTVARIILEIMILAAVMYLPNLEQLTATYIIDTLSIIIMVVSFVEIRRFGGMG